MGVPTNSYTPPVNEAGYAATRGRGAWREFPVITDILKESIEGRKRFAEQYGDVVRHKK